MCVGAEQIVCLGWMMDPPLTEDLLSLSLCVVK